MHIFRKTKQDKKGYRFSKNLQETCRKVYKYIVKSPSKILLIISLPTQGEKCH